MKRLACLALCCLLLAGCNGNRQTGIRMSAVSPADSPAQSSESQPLLPEQSQPEYNLHVIDHDQLPEQEEEDILEIREKLFIAQTNEIYINAEDYLGKTLRYEGIYHAQYIEELGDNIHYIFRYGPGCCGYDGNAGFEVVWDQDFPPHDSWVRATGVLEEYGENNWKFLRVRLTDVEVLEERGLEYVTH